jgi:hypothetical protein
MSVVDPDEVAREQRADERRRQVVERRAEDRRVEAEALRRVNERWGETADPINVAGYKVRPGGRVGN